MLHCCVYDIVIVSISLEEFLRITTCVFSLKKTVIADRIIRSRHSFTYCLLSDHNQHSLKSAMITSVQNSC